MEQAELAATWSSTLNQIIFLPHARDEVVEQLDAAIGQLVRTLRSPTFTPDEAAEVGERLVEFGLTKPICLQCSLELLGTELPRLAEVGDVDQLAGRIPSVLAALGGGLAAGMRQRLFAEQDDIKKALVKAKENAELDLRASEARFEEIFTSSTVGMAISELDGTLIRINQALAGILEYRSDELMTRKLVELFHPDEAQYLLNRYQEVLAEDTLPFRERRRLLRRDNEAALVHLSASVLRDADGLPRYYVTTAEDISDKHMLEGQLHFQATHDALTGLANRQRFIGRIEEALAGDRAGADLILLHIDLDGFRAVNDGPGRHVGDQLLKVVANRLGTVVADEHATVARLDADEFGILIENSPTTPAGQTIAARINDELSEPVYVDGHGVAATASIAVLTRPARSATPAELLQATDITLRRLKATGRRQWALVDADQNSRDQERFNMAASLPGAWESGELELEYQPLFEIIQEGGERPLVAVQALLRWDHAELGLIDHQRCAEVLEETGLSVPVGRWLLERAAEQLRLWKGQFDGRTPRLYVELTRQQAADPDLVSAVSGALSGAELGGDQLLLGMPVRALCTVDGVAEDNLDVLADLGVETVLHEFGTTRGDLACLDDLPVVAVKFADRAVRRVADRGNSSLFTRSVLDLVPLVRDHEVAVYVGTVRTDDELEWWRKIGASAAQGPLLGEPCPAERIQELLAR